MLPVEWFQLSRTTSCRRRPPARHLRRRSPSPARPSCTPAAHPPRPAGLFGGTWPQPSRTDSRSKWVCLYESPSGLSSKRRERDFTGVIAPNGASDLGVFNLAIRSLCALAPADRSVFSDWQHRGLEAALLPRVDSSSLGELPSVPSRTSAGDCLGQNDTTSGQPSTFNSGKLSVTDRIKSALCWYLTP